MRIDMDSIDKLAALQRNIQTVLLGKEDAVRKVTVALLAGGHILLEDVPGVGKTILARALAKSIDCTFSRIQFTPDLLPSDILGISVYDSQRGDFVFKPGPLFANIVLIDEINRTTPRTQSALLEAMNEHQVTADGTTYPLGPPFMVLATQNPYEYEGTYFLPECQLDRFMLCARIGYPDKETEREILTIQPAKTRLEQLTAVMGIQDRMDLREQMEAVRIDESIIDYIIAIAEATRKSDDLVTGLSPRGALALTQAGRAEAMLSGRNYVVPDDVKNLAVNVCAHRLAAKALAHDGANSEAIFQKILETVPAPQ